MGLATSGAIAVALSPALLGSPALWARQSTITSGLAAEYFGNPTLTGTPLLRRVDAQVDFDWPGQPATGVPADRFSVRWTGTVRVPVTGQYSFGAISDAGVRLWVNGGVALDAWGPHGASIDRGAPVLLEAGKAYPLRLEMHEDAGSARATLLWSGPGLALQKVPSSALAPSAVPAPAPSPSPSAPPPAPAGLTAQAEWRDDCRCCGGVSMPVVRLSWQAVRGAASYRVYRDGVRVASGVLATGWTDMGTTAGATHAYRVSSVGADGREGAQSAPVSVTAPACEMPHGGHRPASSLPAPVNLRIAGVWANAAGPTDRLTWDPVPGATRYRVYQYDRLIADNLTQPTLLVPPSLFVPMLTYTVTAIDASGAETVPSAPVTAQGAGDPARPSLDRPQPLVPYAVTATPEWNAGRPRVRLAWRGDRHGQTYNVYRSGRLLASGLWGLTYLDTTVAPGQSHTYTVSTVVVPSGAAPVESAPSSPATAAPAPSGPPSQAAGPVRVLAVEPNDDSVQISFSAVPGAADYRVFDPSNPGTVKYSGGGTRVEWNGLRPGVTTRLVIEAVDKLGPYQKMDGEMGPGTMDSSGRMVNVAINGQGDPSNRPNAVASSGPFEVRPRRFTLTGEQAFLDTFRDSKPFTPFALGGAYTSLREVSAIANDRWIVYNFSGDRIVSRAFVMGNHFMDTLYDGGTVGTNNPLHMANSSLVMQPRQSADISGGRVLHVTFEVDAHFAGRRWCDVLVTEAGDPLLNPNKFSEGDQLPTTKGNAFRWQIFQQHHAAQVFLGMDPATGELRETGLSHLGSTYGPARGGNVLAARTTWNNLPLANGTMQDLDRRTRFDLYLSQDRCQLYEDGKIRKDIPFPAGVRLPFTRASVYFVHKLYHTRNDRREHIAFNPNGAYWINYRTWADERHWDNMGFEVLPAFPALPAAK